MKTNVSSLGQGPGLAWKRGSSSFPPGSLAELEEWTGGATEPPEPPWHGDVTFQQWNTIGWGITDDGVLCIKPWEGDTGETGSVTTGNDIPWNDKVSKIKKVESTGTIVLNECSTGLFSGCSDLTDITGLAGWDVSNVTSMSFMFGGCSSLTDLAALANWNVSNVTDMDSMFSSCSSLTDLTGLKDWNVSTVTYMDSMFSSCSSLTDLSALANWDVSSVTSMDSMFYDCSSLTDLTGIADWNVSNVENMDSMFYDCSSLTDLSGLRSWNMSNVYEMRDMFYYCSSLQRIGIPSIRNGGQKLVENADDAKLTTVLPSIISEDGSMGPYTWDDLNTEMTTNLEAFLDGTVWIKAEEAA